MKVILGKCEKCGNSEYRIIKRKKYNENKTGEEYSIKTCLVCNKKEKINLSKFSWY